MRKKLIMVYIVYISDAFKKSVFIEIPLSLQTIMVYKKTVCKSFNPLEVVVSPSYSLSKSSIKESFDKRLLRLLNRPRVELF